MRTVPTKSRFDTQTHACGSSVSAGLVLGRDVHVGWRPLPSFQCIGLCSVAVRGRTNTRTATRALSLAIEGQLASALPFLAGSVPFVYRNGVQGSCTTCT